MSGAELPAHDLTDLLKTVMSGRARWSEEKARALFDRCAALCSATGLWWEVGSDDWPSFEVDGETVFTVHVRFPLCLVRSPHDAALRALIQDAGAHVIGYDDWAASLYRVRPGTLNALAGYEVEEAPDDRRTDPGRFSLWDLWYDTL